MHNVCACKIEGLHFFGLINSETQMPCPFRPHVVVLTPNPLSVLGAPRLLVSGAGCLPCVWEIRLEVHTILLYMCPEVSKMREGNPMERPPNTVVEPLAQETSGSEPEPSPTSQRPLRVPLNFKGSRGILLWVSLRVP